MKIDKAIEILKDLLGEGPQFSPDDRREAVQLGVEALSYVERSRAFGDYPVCRLLPGETEQEEVTK